MLDEPFTTAVANNLTLEPEDEEHAVATVKRSESSDRLTWGWGALPIVRAGAMLWTILCQ